MIKNNCFIMRVMKNNIHKKNQDALEKAVKLAGGEVALARLCGPPITQSHVHNWRFRNKFKRLPGECVLNVEYGLNKRMTRYQLRPDLYPHEEFKAN